MEVSILKVVLFLDIEMTCLKLLDTVTVSCYESNNALLQPFTAAKNFSCNGKHDGWSSVPKSDVMK